MHETPSRWSAALGSLKLHLAVAGVLLISLSVGVTGFFVLDAVAQRTERTVIDSKQSEAEKLAAVLATRVTTLRDALRSAATQLPLHQLDQPQAMVAFLEQNPVLLGLFSGFHIAAPDGRLLAVADGHRIRTSDITIADRGYFQKTLAERRATVSEAFISRVSGAPILIMSLPVLTGKGDVAAVLGGVLRLESRGLMADLTEVGSHAGDPASTITAQVLGALEAEAATAGPHAIRDFVLFPRACNETVAVTSRNDAHVHGAVQRHAALGKGGCAQRCGNGRRNDQSHRCLLCLFVDAGPTFRGWLERRLLGRLFRRERSCMRLRGAQ